MANWIKRNQDIIIEAAFLIGLAIAAVLGILGLLR